MFVKKKVLLHLDSTQSLFLQLEGEKRTTNLLASQQMFSPSLLGLDRKKERKFDMQ
jgi:hypothetical protein